MKHPQVVGVDEVKLIKFAETFVAKAGPSGLLTPKPCGRVDDGHAIHRQGQDRPLKRQSRHGT